MRKVVLTPEQERKAKEWAALPIWLRANADGVKLAGYGTFEQLQAGAPEAFAEAQAHAYRRRRWPEDTRPPLGLRLLIETAGNPDFDEDPHSSLSPRLDIECSTLAEAVQYAEGYRDYYNLGGGNWQVAVIKSARDGTVLAHVSYNGRVWEGRTWPTTEIDPSTSVEDLEHRYTGPRPGPTR